MTQDTFFHTIAILGGITLTIALIWSEYDHYWTTPNKQE